MAKKLFFASHAKSSAAMVSLAIHAVLIVVAVSFVAVKVIVKPEQTFETKQVRRPKVPLKKLQVPVNIKKKKTQAPKLRKRIVVKKEVKSVEIKMPEITGIKGGTGYLDGGGGLGSLGFGLEIDLFGGNKGSGNELEGTFFDLKAKPDGSPSDLKELPGKEDRGQNNKYTEVLRNFAGSWNISRFEKRYFKAPKKKFATTFQVPYMRADEAPKAYAVDDVVKPKRWVAYYNGKIAAPESGRYRFWGIADDVLMVRIKRNLVIDANWPGLKGKITDWESDDERNRKFKSGGKEQGLVIGDWFFLGKDKPTDMEVLIGEQPGGQFFCRLFIEQDGVDYPKAPDGRPILPIFKTVDVPEKLVPQMKIDPNVGTVEGPNFGVLK